LRWRLLEAREGTLDLQGRRTEQRADLDALQQLADSLDDDTRRANVAFRRSRIAKNMADYHVMETFARQAMVLAGRVGAVEAGLDAQRLLANARVHLGDLDSGKKLAQDGLTAVRVHGLRRVEGLYLNTLSIINSRQQDVIATLDLCRQCLLIARELGNRQNEATAFGNLGQAWLDVGEHTQAKFNLGEGLRLARAAGYLRDEPYILTGLSRLALWQGDFAFALAHAQAALDIAIAVGDRNAEGEGLCHLGDAELALGRHEAAKAALERAHGVTLALGDLSRYDVQAGLARVALAQGDATGAMQAVEGLLAHHAGGGTFTGTNWPGLIWLSCHKVLAHAGDPRAAEVLATANAELQTRAAAITDSTLRHSFVDNIPEHREIVAAWASSQAAVRRP
jgi:tetratricopeptide (TPR) repeat protein